MGHKFAELAFTPSVREVQEALGSRANYAAMERGADYNHLLTENEAAFIQARDSFYMASVSETGWPYVQHRGGPVGFVRVLDERTLGFADFRGNRQYVSVGNIRRDDRVALFFMDYPHRTRLKVLGRVRLLGLDSEQLAKLEVPDYRARVERGFIIHVEAFDWNCPQHITPRYTESEIKLLIAPLVEENRALKSARGATRMTQSSALGDGPMELCVAGIRQLTPRIRAFELRDPDGAELPAIEPGAHLRVPVRLANGTMVVRHYSIFSDPARRDTYEIAVLREEEGTGGSRAVHESFGLGLRLRCDFAQSYFHLHADTRPAVLIAGGVGITAVLSMAHALQRRGVELQLHYAARSRRDMALREQLLRDFTQGLKLYSSADGERMDIEHILAMAPQNAMVYVCGPARLIDAVGHVAAAIGIAADRIRFERFDASVPADSRPVDLELRRSRKTLHVRADQTLLDAMLEAGVDVPYSCKAGACKTCAMTVLTGEPEHRDSALSDLERSQQRLMCPCISRAKSDRLVLDI
jgi:ferredoxin-NADP reductase/predicted pyridoxine 5'-phosphate oxidase superfamily flavin-nucleotide-binding protein